MMALRTIMTFSTLLLVTCESGQTTVTPNREISISAPSNNTGEGCSCPSSDAKETVEATSSPKSSPPALGLLNITWRGCRGDVKLILHHPSSSSYHVCHDKEIYVKSLFENVCENKKGCQGQPRWLRGKQENGYYISENGTSEGGSCEKLQVTCTVAEPPQDVQGQLKAYKVVTALMSCVLLLLLLIRFTKPTVKALQRRLSDKRQNRWIGPTQSHSVSYHRGKTAVKNNDREKRLSYPALERLTVSDSREPSSNRNSDYNL